MSTVSTSSRAITTSSPWSSWFSGDRWILTLHVLAIVLNLPLLLIYFRELLQQPHYQFAPFVLLFLAIYVRSRVVEFERVTFSLRGIWANGFLFLAIPFVLFANLRFDPEFAGIGCFLIAASLLARTRDRATGESMLPVVFALALMFRLPFGLDNRLITSLQRLTSQIASRVLDLFGINHLLSGNVIRMESRPFMVEEACSGIQSLFLLLFCALAWVAWARRGLIRSVLLVLAAVGWAIVCNSGRVIAICVAHVMWNVDLASGIPHVITGYFFMFAAIGLLISTDFLLEFMFGRGEVMVHSRRHKLALLLFGGRPPKDRGISKAWMPTAVSKPLVSGICALLAAVSLIPLFVAGPQVIIRQLTRKYIVRDIPMEAIQESFSVPMPNNVSVEWKREKYEVEQRDLNSEWGSRSSRWFLVSESFSPPKQIVVSLDYPFTGWHELTGCYRGNGWLMEKRLIMTSEFAPDWPVVVGKFRLPTGKNGLLLFSLFDEHGRPTQTILDDVIRSNLLQRAITTIQKRLNKEYGPLAQTYQVQIFIESVEELSDENIKLYLESYARIREMIRQGVIPNDQRAAHESK